MASSAASRAAIARRPARRQRPQPAAGARHQIGRHVPVLERRRHRAVEQRADRRRRRHRARRVRRGQAGRRARPPARSPPRASGAAASAASATRPSAPPIACASRAGPIRSPSRPSALRSPRFFAFTSSANAGTSFPVRSFVRCERATAAGGPATDTTAAATTAARTNGSGARHSHQGYHPFGVNVSFSGGQIVPSGNDGDLVAVPALEPHHLGDDQVVDRPARDRPGLPSTSNSRTSRRSLGSVTSVARS